MCSDKTNFVKLKNRKRQNTIFLSKKFRMQIL